jgi:hypothetical protein
MCFVNSPEMPDPAPPPEVLKQDAPNKKTANQNRAKTLSLGSKKYRTNGLGGTSAPTTTSASPSVNI